MLQCLEYKKQVVSMENLLVLEILRCRQMPWFQDNPRLILIKYTYFRERTYLHLNPQLSKDYMVQLVFHNTLKVILCKTKLVSNLRSFLNPDLQIFR